LLGLSVNHRADALAAHLKDSSGLASRLDDLRPIAVNVNHRLLEVHIFPGVHRVNGRLLVPMVGSGDQHGVDVRTRQNLVIIASGQYGVAPQLAAMCQSAVVAVGRRDQPHSGHLERHLGVILALAARPNESELDLVVGGPWRFLRSFLGQDVHARTVHQPTSARNQTPRLQKSSSVDLSPHILCSLHRSSGQWRVVSRPALRN